MALGNGRSSRTYTIETGDVVSLKGGNGEQATVTKVYTEEVALDKKLDGEFVHPVEDLVLIMKGAGK